MATGLEAMALLIASGACFGFLPTHLADALPLPHKLMEVKGPGDLSYATDFALVRDRTRPVSRPAEMFQFMVSATFGRA